MSSGFLGILTPILGLLNQPEQPKAPTPIPPPPPPPEPQPERGADPNAVLSEEAAKNVEAQRRRTNYKPSALMTNSNKKSLLGE